MARAGDETTRLKGSLADDSSPAANAHRPLRIFLTYRRDDAAAHGMRLYDDLVARFGREQVLFDVDAIQAGVDLVKAIGEAVGSCDVLIALVGPGWVGVSDSEGRPRLENPADFVRVEIEAALARDMRVIPVLVEDAKMPSPDELPHGLVPFTLKNALRLRGVWWREDVDGLLLALERIAEEKPGAERAEQAERKRAEQARHERAKRERAERDARERAEQEQVEQAREADERRRTQTGIFICYRREDSRWQARLLADALQERFGEENVFVDVERIGIGSWRAQIAQALDASAVVLVVIGPNWLEELERRGEGKDEVRFEIAAAITRGIPILPVTLAGVEVPDRGVLPEDIAALVDEQVWPLGQDQLWKPSVDILIRALASSFEAGISEAASDAP